MLVFKNRNFALLLVSATIMAVLMPSLIILGGLAGYYLAPREELATLPISIQIVAGFVSIGTMSIFMGRFGRRSGFLVAAVIGSLGGIIVGIAIFRTDFILLCIGHALFGVALASFSLFRFAAAELVDTEDQSRAISTILGSGLVAALLSPEIYRLSKLILPSFELVGPYIVLSGLSLVGTIPLFFVQFPMSKRGQKQSDSFPNSRGFIKRGKLLWAVIVGASSAAAMTLLMTPTSIAMVEFGYADFQAGNVIRWHVVAMFAPSFVTGTIIKKFGVAKVISVGAALFAISGLVAVSGIQLVNFYVSLIILGIGWNFSFIGASTLLVSQSTEAERPLSQGFNDTIIALTGSLASFGSGALLVTKGWPWIAGLTVLFGVVVFIGGTIPKYKTINK